MISKMLLWMVKHAAWRGHKFGLWNFGEKKVKIYKVNDKH